MSCGCIIFFFLFFLPFSGVEVGQTLDFFINKNSNICQLRDFFN